MQLHILDNELWFPPLHEALEDGLLAVGGDLSTDRLILAYRSGIFPWFGEDEIPMWWSPDPRFVLLPNDLYVSKSMKKVLKAGKFEFRMNTSFNSVINNCKEIYRPGQPGTWISDEIVESYTTLHHLGYAQSAETWRDGVLLGGLYGIRMGKAFFGESMFSHESNASKFAFINWVQQLKSEGVALIDCQIHTTHLESLGAHMMPRIQFMETVKMLIDR